MKLLILLVPFIALAQSGHVSHDDRATSYQNVHFEHFHAVPTYIKKEDKHLLEHPISLGKTSSKVEVHHGDKHDQGYAFTDHHNDLHSHSTGLELGEDHNLGTAALSLGGGGHEVHEDHLDGQDQGTDFHHLQEAAQAEAALGHGGYQNADLGHYHQLAAAAASLGAGNEHEQAFDGHGLGHYKTYHDSR